MPRKSACKKLKQNTLKQNNLSASIDVKTYDPDTVIDNDVEIVGGYHLKYSILLYSCSFFHFLYSNHSCE